MAIKYSNIFHCKTLRIYPNWGFLVSKYVIWQPWPKVDFCATVQGNAPISSIPTSWLIPKRSFVDVQITDCQNVDNQTVDTKMYVDITY
jgi:hypothetical protein